MSLKLVNLYVALETPHIMQISKAIQDGINPKDVFKGLQWAESGFETSPHVTLMFSEPTSELPQISKIISELVSKQVASLKNTPIRITGISRFDNSDDYDVIKFDIDPTNLMIYRDFIRMQFGVEATFPTFHPHITIAYVNKGVFETLDLPTDMSFDIDASSVKIAIRGNYTNGDKIDDKSIIKL